MNHRITSIQDYEIAYKKSITHPELFWDGIASEYIWNKKWSKTLEWDFSKPDIKWFIDGKLISSFVKFCKALI